MDHFGFGGASEEVVYLIQGLHDVKISKPEGHTKHKILYSQYKRYHPHSTKGIGRLIPIKETDDSCLHLILFS